MKTQFEQLMESPEFRKLYAIEGLVTEAGEFIARLMQEQGVTKAELARRLGKSRAYITQMLSGSANLTVRTLAEVAYALGAEVRLEAVPVEAVERKQERAELPSPVWKVIEIPRSLTRADRNLSPPMAVDRPSRETGSAYQYVA
jgi:transcriptional regulator with XRE-family HTH domain